MPSGARLVVDGCDSIPVPSVMLSGMSPLSLLRRVGARRVPLVPMTPREQMRAGSLTRRIVQLLIGLILFGVSMALLLLAGLGLEPWGVLHYGLIQHVPLSYGEMSIVVSFVVLLLWVPLRQWPGLGTILNAIIIGVAIDATLALVSAPAGLAARIGLMLVAIIGNGIAGALYIGSQLGPGPRDGLMTGLSHRTGRSIRLVRTLLEVSVLGVGWLLGGIFGIGTILYAVLIGPVIQFFLPLVTVRVTPPGCDATGGSRWVLPTSEDPTSDDPTSDGDGPRVG